MTIDRYRHDYQSISFCILGCVVATKFARNWLQPSKAPVKESAPLRSFPCPERDSVSLRFPGSFWFQLLFWERDCREGQKLVELQNAFLEIQLMNFKWFENQLI